MPSPRFIPNCRNYCQRLRGGAPSHLPRRTVFTLFLLPMRRTLRLEPPCSSTGHCRVQDCGDQRFHGPTACLRVRVDRPPLRRRRTNGGGRGQAPEPRRGTPAAQALPSNIERRTHAGAGRGAAAAAVRHVPAAVRGDPGGAARPRAHRPWNGAPGRLRTGARRRRSSDTSAVRMRARIVIARQTDYAELLAYELEHVLEQLEGWDLAARAESGRRPRLCRRRRVVRNGACHPGGARGRAGVLRTAGIRSSAAPRARRRAWCAPSRHAPRARAIAPRGRRGAERTARGKIARDGRRPAGPEGPARLVTPLRRS